MKQFSATFIPVLMALSMSSCSRLDLGVRWADWAIMREVNSYFDLNSKQDAELRKKVQADLLEVRRKTFPEIANLFRQVAEKLEADQVTPEQIQEWHQVGLGLFQSVLQHFRQTALDFSLALEEKQLFYFQKSFTEKTSKWAEKVKTEDLQKERLEKRFKRWTDEWLGRLNTAQGKALNEQIRNNPYPWDLQIKSRQQNLENFLQAQKSKEGLEEYFSSLEKQRTPEFRKSLANYHQKLYPFIYELYQSLTSAQKKKLIENLREKAQELDKLSKV